MPNGKHLAFTSYKLKKYYAYILNIVLKIKKKVLKIIDTFFPEIDLCLQSALVSTIVNPWVETEI